MAPLPPVPVTVVTGFLGAGKTTLVNRWLGDFGPGEVAVVVNEHGRVGVDAELLAARAREVVEITGGCVCCSTQAELVRALDALASAEPRPRRILVETSGAASPAGVLRAVAASSRRGAHALDGIVTVVDGARIDALAGVDLAIEQVGYADLVVVSRADACDADARARAGAWVSERNGAAFAVFAARGVIEGEGLSTLEGLLDARRADFGAPREVARAGAAHVYESVSLVVEGEVDGERFADFMEGELARVAGRIFRVKGILAVRGIEERMIVQGVADLVEVSFGERFGEAPRRSRVVVVGFGLDAEGLGPCVITQSHGGASC